MLLHMRTIAVHTLQPVSVKQRHIAMLKRLEGISIALSG